MRQTRKVSVWPVGLVGKLKYESPLLNKFGKVFGWRTKWKTERTFALDMAGFAINLKLLANNNAQFTYESPIGELENDFLSQLVTLEDLEPKADNCSKVKKYKLICFYFIKYEARKLIVFSLLFRY